MKLLHYILFIMIIFSPVYSQTESAENSAAPETDKKEENKEKKYTILDPVIVTSTRPGTKKLEQKTPVNIIERKEIEEKIPQSHDEIFKGKAGIDLSHSGAGISRPMIRGLSDSRVLLLADGIRISELRHGGNHALSVDISSIEQVEILRGASSVIYGTDALGGVINFITQPRNNLTEKPFSANASVSYDSASSGTMASASVADSSEHFGYKAGGKIKDTGNIQTPDGELPFSFHDVKSGFGNMYYLAGKNLFALSSYFTYSDIGVPVLASDPALPNALSKAQFEGETHTFVHGTYERNMSLQDTLSLDMAYQYHERHMRQVFAKNGNPVNIDVDITTVNADPRWTHEFSDTNALSAGMQNIFMAAGSAREILKLVATGPSGPVAYNGVPVIPDSMQSQNGVYVQDEWKISSRWFQTLGARYDFIYSETQGHPNHIIKTAQTDMDHNVSATYNLEYFFVPEHVKYTIGVSRSFRAPILLERYFDGPHQGGNDRGNPDLDPEIGWNTQGTLKILYPFFSMEWGLYYNYITQYIEKVDIGSNTDEYQNVHKAHLYGTDADFAWNFFRGFSLFGSITAIRGQNLSQNANLSDIPPVKGRYGLRFEDAISARWKMWQELAFLSAADVLYPGEGEDKTPGYTTVDYYLGFRYGSSLILSFYVKNLADKGYHDHLSRVDPTLSGVKWEQPGRSFGAGVSYTFSAE